ncbi:hypothetical protein [uncultured Algibacter sp.]|uniref:hypothetical protein n=1 Tax=uncultured Algibacter sp. TaxID=298659 RepID=UPI002617E339|nr:hypothetical protein [uncultured Algibacter sp.]
MESTLRKGTHKDEEQLETIIKLEKLLLKVSLEDEEMPEHSYEKALLLLNDINGERLTHKEAKLLHKLIDKKFT